MEKIPVPQRPNGARFFKKSSLQRGLGLITHHTIVPAQMLQLIRRLVSQLLGKTHAWLGPKPCQLSCRSQGAFPGAARVSVSTPLDLFAWSPACCIIFGLSEP